jgi:hypothetical protein
MLERLEFQQLVEEMLTAKRGTRAMSMYQFVVVMVLAAYVGFSRRYRRSGSLRPSLAGTELTYIGSSPAPWLA